MPQSKIALSSYVPLPTQRAFHSSDALFRAFVGGFGSGKTLAGCWEALDLSVAYPRNVGLICRKTYRELADSTQRTFMEIVPPQLVASYSKRDEVVTLTNGSQIMFRSLDDIQKFRSVNLGWWYLDEASEIDDEDVPTMLLGRLRLAHVPWRGAFVTSNPPHQDHWLYKWAVEKAVASPSRYMLVQASTYDNPFLPREYVETLEKEYSAQWVSRFLAGEFGHITPGTPVYEHFMEKIHVVQQIEWLHDRPVFRSWDFGWLHPAVLYSQIGPDRQWLIVREKMGNRVLLHKFAEEVITDSAVNFPGAKFIDVGDPAGHQHDDKSGFTSIEILRRNFEVNLITRRTPKKKSIELIDQRFARMRKNREGEAEPMVRISKSGCPVLIEGFAGGYAWPKSRDGRITRETPIEDGWFEHLQDCAQYAAAAIFIGGFGGERLEITEPTWRFS